jgi:transcriptional regulator with XRE-family HTH domain
MNIFMSTVGERLRSLRHGIQLSQKAIAELQGVTQSAINRYENNESKPAFRVLLWYADYFDVSLDYLFCRTDNPQGKLYQYDPIVLKNRMANKRDWEEFIEACFDEGSPMNAKLKESLINMAGGDVK